MKSRVPRIFALAAAGIHRGQKGMTGLETAIIMIAFVTVAALFGYAVLSAGLFSAERGKETIYANLQQAKANLEISGSVVVRSTGKVTADHIDFTLRNAIAGAPIDLTPNYNGTAGQNKCVMGLTTAEEYYNDIKWECTRMGSADSDYLLEAGEQFGITIHLDDLGVGGAPALSANDWFNIQVKPTQGSTTTIQRTLPAGLETVMDLY